MDGLGNAALEDGPQVRIFANDVAGERDGGLGYVGREKFRYDQDVAGRLRPLQRQQAGGILLVLRQNPVRQGSDIEEFTPRSCGRKGPSNKNRAPSQAGMP